MELLGHESFGWIIGLVIALTLVRSALWLAERRAVVEGAAACSGAVAVQAPPPAPARAAGEVLESLIIAIVLVFLVLRPFVLQAFYIPSESMSPTLTENDRILVNKICYRVGEPRRHEVVVFRAPREATGEADRDEKDFVKRVVGLPGDVVEIHGGRVYVNGRPDDDSFTAEPPQYDLAPFVVPDGKLFVIGDNRNHSNDSHRWGALDRDRLIGRAVMIFWPPSRAGTIR